MTYRKTGLLFFFVCAVLLITFSGCGGSGNESPNIPPTTTVAKVTTTTKVTHTTTSTQVDFFTTETTTTTSRTAKTTGPLPISPDTDLPVYVPGSIRLIPQDEDDYGFERRYRRCYYNMDFLFVESIGDEAFMEWERNEYAKDNPIGQEKEMLLVAFIKKFNIPREQFDAALEKYIRTSIEHGDDLTSEYYEAPNADIIYTFDNEIINEYYRYE